MPEKAITSAELRPTPPPVDLTSATRPAQPSQAAGGDPLSAARPKNGEFVRKLMHMSPGLLPFALAFVPHPRPLDWISQAVVVSCCVVLTMVFLSLHRVVRRPGEDNLLSTAISYPLTVIATVLLFPAHVELTGVVVVVLAFGDGAAYIAGKRFGKRTLSWNPHKTWVGTLSFVAVSGPTSALAYWTLADEGSFAIAAACGFAAAVTGAIAESLPVRLTDNLRVGVSSLLAVALTHHGLVGLTLF